MTLPYWADNDPNEAAAWNTVRLGSVQLPGVCVVTAEKGRDVDLKKAKGQDGYGLTDTGATPGKVSIEVTLATRQDWIDWQKVRPLIDPNRPGATRNPLEIKHPDAEDCGIRNVYVDNIKRSPPSARTGKRIMIECTEWYPQAKTSKGAGKTAKALPAAAPRKNTVVSQVPGETQLGQDFVNGFANNF
ncbi:MAG TPA: hypothetical protein VK540_09990 [Polyangiaceae bacterium]|nr:hypothetical protein [Polyangiaceae bacterium]